MAANTATQRRSTDNAGAGLGLAPSAGPSHSVKALIATIELAASSSGDTIDWGDIPSNARILLASRIYTDDLATTGSPTLDTGLAAVNNNLVNSDDPDAIGNGLALSSASNDNLLVSSIANAGLPAWDLVASESADPGGVLHVYSTVKDAATTATGTITLELYYTAD